MNRDEFEARVLELWMSTRIPLTRAHLQYGTGLSRRKLNGWLDEMVGEGVLEFDSDDDGEMVWTVPGAARAPSGPRTFAEAERLDTLRAEARRKVRESRALAVRKSDALAVRKSDALALLRDAGVKDTRADGEKHKSLLLSAGLSFFGPLGWLYAGSLREAVPAAAAALLIAALVPTFLLMPVLWLAMPLSAIVGLIYAWQYNRAGERTPLFLDDKKSDET